MEVGGKTMTATFNDLAENAAGSVLLEGTHVVSGCVYAGVPAKKVKDINKELFEGEIQRISNNYVMYASWFKTDEK